MVTTPERRLVDRAAAPLIHKDTSGWLTAFSFGWFIGEYLKMLHSDLRGRRPVRADRRLRTDEKHVRAQAAILD